MRSTALILALIQFGSLACAETIMGLPFDAPQDRFFRRCEGTYNKTKEFCASTGSYGVSERTPNASIMLEPPTSPETGQAAVPAWVLPGQYIVLGTNADGHVVRMEMITRASMQASVIAAVSDKFGQPSRVDEVTKQNAYGAKWQVQEAEWVTSRAVVSTFCYRFDRCSLKFLTTEEAAAETKRRADAKASNKL